MTWQSEFQPNRVYEEIDFQDLKVEDLEVEDKNTMNEHLKSFLITFFVAFAMVVVANIDNINAQTIESGAVLGVLGGAIRAGVKGVLELFLSWYNK